MMFHVSYHRLYLVPLCNNLYCNWNHIVNYTLYHYVTNHMSQFRKYCNISTFAKDRYTEVNAQKSHHISAHFFTFRMTRKTRVSLS